MRLALITANILFFLFAACVSSHNNSYPELSNNSPSFIKTKADSFYVTGSNLRNPWGYAIGASDTVSPGTDGYKGGYMQLITKEDTAQFNYTSTPYSGNSAQSDHFMYEHGNLLGGVLAFASIMYAIYSYVLSSNANMYKRKMIDAYKELIEEYTDKIRSQKRSIFKASQ